MNHASRIMIKKNNNKTSTRTAAFYVMAEWQNISSMKSNNVARDLCMQENEYIPDAGPEDKDTRKAYCLLCDNNNTVGWACSKCMLMMCDHCQHYHQLFSDEEHNLCQIQPDVNAWSEFVETITVVLLNHKSVSFQDGIVVLGKPIHAQPILSEVL